MPKLIAVPGPDCFIHPPCPPWCTRHADSDAAIRRGELTDAYRTHYGRETRLTVRPGNSQTCSRVVSIAPSRYDVGGKVGDPELFVCEVEDTKLFELMDMPLDVASAERLARMLLDAVAVARSEPA